MQSDAEQPESAKDDAAIEDLVIDGNSVSGGSSHSSSRSITSAQVAHQRRYNAVTTSDPGTGRYPGGQF